MLLRAKSPTGKTEYSILARTNVTDEWVVLDVAVCGKGGKSSRAHITPEDALEVGYALINSAHDLLDERAAEKGLDAVEALIEKRVRHAIGHYGKVIGPNPEFGKNGNANDVLVQWDDHSIGPTISESLEVIDE